MQPNVESEWDNSRAPSQIVSLPYNRSPVCASPAPGARIYGHVFTLVTHGTATVGLDQYAFTL